MTPELWEDVLELHSNKQNLEIDNVIFSLSPKSGGSAFFTFLGFGLRNTYTVYCHITTKMTEGTKQTLNWQKIHFLGQNQKSKESRLKP